MVVASHLQLKRAHGILAGVNREFLAWRICLASAPARFRYGGRVLRGLVRHRSFSGRCFLVPRPIETGRSPIGSNGCAFEFLVDRRVFRVPVGQFWFWPVSLSFA